MQCVDAVAAVENVCNHSTSARSVSEGASAKKLASAGKTLGIELRPYGCSTICVGQRKRLKKRTPGRIVQNDLHSAQLFGLL